ncbi:MAG: leucine--tRNA ligase [Planctomycetota bacterium]|nr:MAG: leucine--tRNA ligase [Planctomycetota bacterium]
MPRYQPSRIEPKWQAWWETHHTFATPRLPSGRKAYILDMFPYPSGDGLHVGHPEGYTATDIVSRFERMRGTSVMHPMGFDAFGLPAEEHAIRTGTPPRESTQRNIDTFRRQLKMLGFSYDWSRELSTTDPEYVRWTQAIFLVLFDTWFDTAQQKGRPIADLPIPLAIAQQGLAAVATYRDTQRLAYQSQAPVNWCAALGTVLANEEVIGGVSERGGHPVVRIPLRQWMLRITAYADRLDSELTDLDWPSSIKKLQRDWIGRSTGAEVDFFIAPQSSSTNSPAADDLAPFTDWLRKRQNNRFSTLVPSDALRVYTTRPDTLYGATYLVVAPEHPLLSTLTTSAQQDAVSAYCQSASRKSDLDRTDVSRQKTGVFTGSFCIHPLTHAPLAVWVADYVLATYGTGAIMAVPAHDDRDWAFAEAFGLEKIAVVEPLDQEPTAPATTHSLFTGYGRAVASGIYTGLQTQAFIDRVAVDLEAAGVGRPAVNYKLRDWLFSRQRFWGEPFPILHELDADGKPTGAIRVIEHHELPVRLPELIDFRPGNTPEPPLGRSGDDWLLLERDGKRYRRETNTMPQWAGSCWYFLRFLDPGNADCLIDPEVERAWMPVDLYIGGAEHAVLHLLYSRFWHKVLYDRGYVSHLEPFGKLVNQGMILGEMEFTGYRRAAGGWVSAEQHDKHDTAARVAADQVEKQGDHFVLRDNPRIRVDSRAYKMSKSRGNVVNPDQVVRDFGADSLRLYEMFMGPLEATKPWSTAGVGGVRGFLDRCWRLVVDERADEIRLASQVVDDAPSDDQLRELHRTIDKVTKDIQALSFNTAIARMMEFVNFLTPLERRSREVLQTFVAVLSPFAPHLAEELWELLGRVAPASLAPWPVALEQWLRDDTVEIPVQIQGKLKGRIVVAAGADAETIQTAALSDPKIAELLAGKEIVKIVAVPGRLINFVLKG